MYASKEKDDAVRTAKATAQSLQDNISNAASEAKDDIRSIANTAGRKVRDLYDAACDEVTNAKDTVTTQIRTKPIQSSLVALGVGFVLGALFRR